MSLSTIKATPCQRRNRMSEHFTKKEDAEKRTDWTRFFRRSYKPTTVGEVRFIRHAKMRAALLFAYLAAFTYMNPEYSWTATWIQSKYRERVERIAAEEQLRVTPSQRKPGAADSERPS